MRLRLILLASGSLIFMGGLNAQEIKRVPIQPPSGTTGKEMFAEYCAVCHGSGGRGDGVAALALKKKPADLTQLARNNGGVFPETQLFRYIKGSDEVGGRRNRDMPVWGEVLRSLRPDQPQVAELRIVNLEKYVESLQAH